jgi:hypothetical protein
MGAREFELVQDQLEEEFHFPPIKDCRAFEAIMCLHKGRRGINIPYRVKDNRVDLYIGYGQYKMWEPEINDYLAKAHPSLEVNNDCCKSLIRRG